MRALLLLAVVVANISALALGCGYEDSEYVWEKQSDKPDDVENVEEVFKTSWGNLRSCRVKCEDEEGDQLKYNPWTGACSCYKDGSDTYPLTVFDELWAKTDEEREEVSYKAGPEYVWEKDTDPPDDIEDAEEVSHSSFGFLIVCEIECEENDAPRLKYNPITGSCYCYKSGSETYSLHTSLGYELWTETEEEMQYHPKFVWEKNEDPPDTIEDAELLFHSDADTLENCELECEREGGFLLKYNPWMLGECDCYGHGDESFERHTGYEIWRQTDERVADENSSYYSEYPYIF